MTNAVLHDDEVKITLQHAASNMAILSEEHILLQYYSVFITYQRHARISWQWQWQWHMAFGMNDGWTVHRRRSSSSVKRPPTDAWSTSVEASETYTWSKIEKDRLFTDSYVQHRGLILNLISKLRYYLFHSMWNFVKGGPARLSSSK